MSAERASFTHMGVHLGTGSRAECSTYADRAPILVIRSGTAEFDFSVGRTDVDRTAVEFARSLLRQVTAFTAEVERLHALSAAPKPSEPVSLADALKDWSLCEKF